MQQQEGRIASRLDASTVMSGASAITPATGQGPAACTSAIEAPVECPSITGRASPSRWRTSTMTFSASSWMKRLP